jgi:hypothetical protein
MLKTGCGGSFVSGWDGLEKEICSKVRQEVVVRSAAVDGVPAFQLPQIYARANAYSWFVIAELSTRAERADVEWRNALG